MGKNTIIKGAFILTTANLLTRLMGFYYRTCMVKIIGAEGMGLYQLIMPIYMLCWSITSSGLTTTISKLIAQENAKKEYGNCKRILKLSLFISITISLFISLILFFFSNEIATVIIKDSRTYLPLKLLSFAIVFMALGSCVRGYFMGLQKHFFPASSQVIEQIVRIACIFLISPYFVHKGLEYACIAAVWGIVFGEIISFLYVFIILKSSAKSRKIPSYSKTHSMYIICSMALPLTLARVCASFLATIENILIPQRLVLFSSTENPLATFGSITGMAMPLIQLPSAVLMAISMTLVPALSETQTMGNTKKTSLLIKKALCYTTIIGCGMAVVFASFPNEICNVVYHDSSLGSMLLSLCSVAPFLYVNISLIGILNGLGFHSFIFKQNLFTSIINIIFIYFFIPYYGINALIFSMAFSCALTSILGIWKISSKVNLDFSFYRNFFTPLVCATAAYIPVSFFPKCTTIYSFFAQAILLGFIYLGLLFISDGISVSDVKEFVGK